MTINEAPRKEDVLPVERPSQRMMRNWAKRIAGGTARTVPVYVGGQWTLQVLRGKKRAMQIDLS